MLPSSIFNDEIESVSDLETAHETSEISLENETNVLLIVTEGEFNDPNQLEEIELACICDAESLPLDESFDSLAGQDM